jgi:hypothetical protein
VLRQLPAVVGASLALTSLAVAQGSLPMRSKGLTEVEGIKVGHFTLSERPTGCTVIMVDGEGAPGGVSQRGAAPGTRETDLLDPLNLVDKVNAIVPDSPPNVSTASRMRVAIRSIASSHDTRSNLASPLGPLRSIGYSTRSGP